MRTEITTEAEMDSGKDAVKNIAVHVLGTHTDDLGIGGKKLDKRFRGKLHDKD